MTQPYTCDAEGGAISFWLKLAWCDFIDGILCTLRGATRVTRSGVHIYCHLNFTLYPHVFYYIT